MNSYFQVKLDIVYRRLTFTFSAAVMTLQFKESPPCLVQLLQLQEKKDFMGGRFLFSLEEVVASTAVSLSLFLLFTLLYA